MDVKRILERYGWKEGQGLGKDGNGRSEPIKVYQKRDKGGLGLKPGGEFTDQWWTTVFNSTASRISGFDSKEDQVHAQARQKEKTISYQDTTHRLKYKSFQKAKLLDDP